MKGRYEIYRETDDFRPGDWRWRFRAQNGKCIASGEGYRRKSDCLRAIEIMKGSAKCKVLEV